MPADLDSMFSVREVPWHGMGTILSEYPGSWSEARKLAGLDWEPVVEQQYRRSLKRDAAGQPIINVQTGEPESEFVLVDGYKYVVRSDNGYILDSANDSYEIIGHDVMGEIVEAVLDSTDSDVRYETAGALDNGKRVWALAQLGKEIELEGDDSPTRRYLALQNCHNGKGSLKVMATNVRIVCANTWKAAELDSDVSGHCYAFRHTKNWRNLVADAREAVRHGQKQFDKYVVDARELLSLRYDTARTDLFVKEFAIRRAIRNNRGVTRLNLQELLETNSTVAQAMEVTRVGLTGILASKTCAGIVPSAYQMAQAAGEFADHHRRFKTKDTYLSRTMLDVESDKQLAVNLARELATASV